jgi:hypothetical protein
LFGSSIFIMATRRDIVRQNPVLGIFQESHWFLTLYSGIITHLIKINRIE